MCIIYTYTCVLGNNTNFYKFFFLTVKIDLNFFLKDNTLKKLICTKIYSCKIVLLFNFCLHWLSN